MRFTRYTSAEREFSKETPSQKKAKALNANVDTAVGKLVI
jgi:hypothetical protein